MQNQELNFPNDYVVIGQDTTIAENENLFYDLIDVNYGHDPNQASFYADWWNEILASIGVVDQHGNGFYYIPQQYQYPYIDPFDLHQELRSISLESTPSLSSSSSPSSFSYPSPPIFEDNHGAARSMKLTSKKNKNNGEHQCPDCDKRYSRKQDVKRHSTKHKNGVKEKCSYCPSSFDRKDSLRRHKKSCKSRPFL